MKAVVSGVVATWPVGGVAWDYLQYVAGMEQLGYEVTYLEDAGVIGYDPEERTYGEDLTRGVEFLGRALSGLSPELAAAGRWHVRGPDGRTWGMGPDALAEAVAGADVFLNVSGMCLLRDEYRDSRRKVLIDTDPGWNHFSVWPRHDAGELWPGTVGFRGHDAFFTYAVRMGRPDCRLPDLGLEWQPTRPPVVVDRWVDGAPGRRWTTVLTWDNYAGVIEHGGCRFGSKGPELAHVEDMPARAGVALEMAVGGVEPPVDRWRRAGWSVVDAPTVTRTPEDYRRYVTGSRGEFSVAKQIYTATRSGWFSCRSVCYLAAGRPAVLQDTGWSDVVPRGPGLLAFDTADGAARALAAVEKDYEEHAAGARRLAGEYFDARVVLDELLDRLEG